MEVISGRMALNAISQWATSPVNTFFLYSSACWAICYHLGVELQPGGTHWLKAALKIGHKDQKLPFHLITDKITCILKILVAPFISRFIWSNLSYLCAVLIAVFSRSSSYFNRTSILIYACQKWNISMSRPWMDMIWHHIHVMVDSFRVFRALKSVLLEVLSCLLTRGKQWLIHHKTELVPPSDYTSCSVYLKHAICPLFCQISRIPFSCEPLLFWNDRQRLITRQSLLK